MREESGLQEEIAQKLNFAALWKAQGGRHSNMTSLVPGKTVLSTSVSLYDHTSFAT